MGPKSIIFLCLAGLAICNGADVEAEVSSNRILDGQFASQGQFPYAVSIQLLGGQNQTHDIRGHKCGGVLITLEHVVTVASCLFVEVNNVLEPLSGSELRVFAGSVLLTNDTSADHVRAVSNITIHPQYTGAPAFVNDISVLRLSSPFLATVVSPATLPSSNQNLPDFTTCTVAGWGGNDMNSMGSVQLRFANKYIYNQNLCMTIYNPIAMQRNILPSMVCAVSWDLLSSNCLSQIVKRIRPQSEDAN
ncbi:jg24613 [Pararge aegeria aegeria]|uniref:Jg24613 protein n=1 Tax=Pararge aegeria aegeria TaxID=348720 RepID=A0A8S4SPZ8_9NEOP|nr:jg24613 [Pararge aegeria aegeria]